MTSEIEIAVVALAVQRVASAVHELIPKFVSLLPDGSGSPCALAKQALFRAVPADVLFIDASKRPERKEGDDVWTLIRFDLLEPGVSQVRFVDELEAEELSHHGELLSEHFNINDPVQSGLSDLKFKSCIQQQQYTFLGSFDIRKSPERYGAELCFWLNLETSLVQFFLKEPDFESRYGLRPDPIVSAPELLRLDFATDAHPTDNRLRRYTLQELQEDVADIQLIPQVPDGVRELIGRAKMLYVYGYFEYSFFTIASHYTHAAIEAALRARWSLCLPLPSTLKFKDKEVSTERTGRCRDSPSMAVRFRGSLTW